MDYCFFGLVVVLFGAAMYAFVQLGLASRLGKVMFDRKL